MCVSKLLCKKYFWYSYYCKLQFWFYMYLHLFCIFVFVFTSRFYLFIVFHLISDVRIFKSCYHLQFLFSLLFWNYLQYCCFYCFIFYKSLTLGSQGHSWRWLCWVSFRPLCPLLLKLEHVRGPGTLCAKGAQLAMIGLARVLSSTCYVLSIFIVDTTYLAAFDANGTFDDPELITLRGFEGIENPSWM